MKVIVAHPGKQHSYRLATALNKLGVLQYYCTTMYDTDNSLIYKIVKPFLSKDDKKRANTRKTETINESRIIQIRELSGYIEAYLYRRNRWLYEKFRFHNMKRFGIKVAKLAIKKHADVVVNYDTNAYYCFRYLKEKAPNIVRILDMSSCAKPYAKKIYEEEYNRTGHDDLLVENDYFLNEKVYKYYVGELELSDFFLTPSKFIQNSLKYSGFRNEQFMLAPYGSNIGKIDKENYSVDGPLHVLFAGQVVYLKGILYLLEAISSLPESKVVLDIYGRYDSEQWFINKYLDIPNIHFNGLVTFDKMESVYNSADIFVIDSFSEGMSQVGVEAMYAGLPIICSTNSGVNDLVRNGENGFVIEPGNVDMLKEKILYFINNRDEVKTMGKVAKSMAAVYTWDNYENYIAKAFERINRG